MTGTKEPLDYASPRHERTTSPSGAVVLLCVLNGLACVASLCLLPLAGHILTCAGGPKWCHLSAIYLGAPLYAVTLALAACSGGWWVGDGGRASGPLLRTGVAAPLVVATGALRALFVALAVN